MHYYNLVQIFFSEGCKSKFGAVKLTGGTIRRQNGELLSFFFYSVFVKIFSPNMV